MESGLIISNLRCLDEKEIRNYLETFGSINYFKLLPDKFNDNSKICYLNYDSVESAKKALQATDKSTKYGEPMRASYKKVTPSSERNQSQFNGNKSLPLINGHQNTLVTRNVSFARGRGINAEAPKAPQFSPRATNLRSIDLPLDTKISVEIVELKSLNEILARPIIQTDKSKLELNDILASINDKSQNLQEVRVPEINGFYLAKWEEDNNFYRAKLLEKSGNNQYKVCFVDEGTSGDIVRELREFPNELLEIPCQFVACDLECENSDELKSLIISSGNSSRVDIYVTNSELNSGKYRINLFLDDIDVITLYKNQSHDDPRKNRFPNLNNLKKHVLRDSFTKFQIVNYPKQHREVFKIVLTDPVDMTPQLQPLTSSPIPGDIMIYRQPGNYLHRCVIESTKFSANRIVYKIRLVDEDRCLETSKDELFRTDNPSLTNAPRIINCVVDLNSNIMSPDDTIDKITIEDCDVNKNLYVVSCVIRTVATNHCNSSDDHETAAVYVSHIESCSEFYVQFADKESSDDIDRIQTAINIDYNAPRIPSLRDVRINQMVVAPFLDMNYRARVKEIDLTKNLVHVFFVDFGNSDWIKVDKLMTDKDSVSRTAPLAQRCTLPVQIKPDCSSQVVQLFNNYCEGEDVALSIKILSKTNDGSLCVNLMAENKSSFVDILHFKKFVDENASSAPKMNGECNRDMLMIRLRDLEARISKLEKLTSAC